MTWTGRIILSIAGLAVLVPPAIAIAWFAGQDVQPILTAVTPPGPNDQGGLAWMAWTWQTAVFFGVIAWALLCMTLWEVLRPGGNARSPGLFGIDTTRGDRLFITLLLAAYVHLTWLALAGDAPLWIATAISGALGLAIFLLV